MGQRDKELVGLRLWLKTEQDPEKRLEIRILTARRLRAIGQFDAARRVLEAAVAEAPGNPLALRSLGLEQFRDGEISKGLGTYDKGRWQLSSFDKFRRPFEAPFWQGQPLAGKTLLVWAEQGIGDQIMQSRVLEKLLRLGAKITLEAAPRVQPLLKVRNRITFVNQLREADPKLLAQTFDYQTSMLSAWRFVDDPLGDARSIQADAKMTTLYRNAWKGMGPAKNVGLSWHSRAPETGANRGVEPALLRPIVSSGRLRLHSLQYGDFDLREISKQIGAGVLSDNASDPLTDLTRQAAQIAAMDLVITIDNTTAHMAAALGTPCWVLLPKGSEWRWGTPARQQPLYDGVRLFWSDDIDDWSSALWPLYDAVEDWVAGAS